MIEPFLRILEEGIWIRIEDRELITEHGYELLAVPPSETARWSRSVAANVGIFAAPNPFSDTRFYDEGAMPPLDVAIISLNAELLTAGRKASSIWIYPQFCLHLEAYACLTSLASVALYS